MTSSTRTPTRLSSAFKRDTVRSLGSAMLRVDRGGRMRCYVMRESNASSQAGRGYPHDLTQGPVTNVRNLVGLQTKVRKGVGRDRRAGEDEEELVPLVWMWGPVDN